MTQPWYENEALWEDVAPVLFGPRRWEQAPQEVEQLVALVGLPPGAAVLDLPCGRGRHALELARRGFAVTGVDRTAAFLEAARQQSAEEGLEAEWVHSDMRDFQPCESFDLAINMYTSFGYFEDPADDRRVAANFFGALTPGGRFVLELMGREVIASGFQPRGWHELEDGTLWLEERTLVDHWRSIHNRWILVRGGKRSEFGFTLRTYAASELLDLLRDTGFTDAVAYGSLEGTPYDQDAKRLVVVARK
ncbi:MAG: class I SAM-dependent methyltransferase [Planctomycetota bacterium]|jgi:SAM-dependent methyltransferase